MSKLLCSLSTRFFVRHWLIAMMIQHEILPIYIKQCFQKNTKRPICLFGVLYPRSPEFGFCIAPMFLQLSSSNMFDWERVLRSRNLLKNIYVGSAQKVQSDTCDIRTGTSVGKEDLPVFPKRGTDMVLILRKNNAAQSCYFGVPSFTTSLPYSEK